MRTSRFAALSLTLVALATCAAPLSAQSTVTVDPGKAWLGYMNVFNLPAPDGDGAFQFGNSWGTADLVAVFDGPVLTLTPNTIGDPDPYWYIGGGGPGALGNKIMDANMYVEDDTLAGQTVTFTGKVLSNTLSSDYTSVAFIKDFAPDYSSFNQTTVELTPGVFSITLATDTAPGRHIQYGFETIGRNVWITDVAQFGAIEVTAIPEPAGVALACCGLIAGLRRRRG